jgi:hypothetical protein
MANNSETVRETDTLVEWSVEAKRPTSVAEHYVIARPWRQLDIDNLRAAVVESSLCRPEDWPDDIDRMAEPYDETLTTILGDQQPARRRV